MPVDDNGIIQRRGAPACPVESKTEGGPLLYISPNAQANWSRFWSSEPAAKAWDGFMAHAQRINLGGWWNDKSQ